MFIAFPLQNKPDWRRPPWATLLLILINMLVFWGPQRDDEKRLEAAQAYYLSSSLPGIEMPLYLRLLEQRKDRASAKLLPAVRQHMLNKNWAVLVPLVTGDIAFETALAKGTVVGSQHAEHTQWQTDRARYAQLRGESFTQQWMSVPSMERLETLFTSTFLHGGTSHLIGNMVFLFAFGYTVELVLGGGWFLLFYVLAGLGGSALDVFVRSGSDVGGLGASGAISGLMAMYAVLYGFQKVRFFYQFLFYFDYVRAPAIVLLPAWILNEVVQQWLHPEAGVAFMAHAGGLVTGALLLGAYKLLRKGKAKAKVAQLQTKAQSEQDAKDSADAFTEDLLHARQLLQKMRFDEARAAYARLCEAQPQNVELLRSLHTLVSSRTGDEQYHQCVHRICSLPAKDAETLQWTGDVFERYMASAQPRPRLSANRVVATGIKLARGGVVSAALRAETLAHQMDAQHAQLPMLRLTLVTGLLKAKRKGEAHAVFRRLQGDHPQADEVRLAQQLLA